MPDGDPPNTPPALGDLERAVMETIWSGPSECTVRDVLLKLNAQTGRERAYTTIMTIMRKLDRKGLVSRRRVGKTDVYLAVIGRDEYADARASAEVGALVREYGDVAIANFAREMARLDPATLERLRRHADT